MGPIWGGLIGAFPQCGFSAAASYFYIGRVITLGTLISIYMSTSDEMLPILISEKVAGLTILKIMGTKVVIGMISGFLVELFFGWMARRKKRPRDFDGEPHSGHCDCGTGIFVEAARHALKVFLFILIVSLAIGLLIYFVGEENIYLLFSMCQFWEKQSPDWSV